MRGYQIPGMHNRVPIGLPAYQVNLHRAAAMGMSVNELVAQDNTALLERQGIDMEPIEVKLRRAGAFMIDQA